MPNSLDRFARYIEKQQNSSEQSRDDGAVRIVQSHGRTAGSAGESETAAPVRYELRNGVTLTVPAKPEIPSPEAVLPERHAPALSVPAWPSDIHPDTIDSEDTAVGRDAALWHRLPRHIQILVSMAEKSEEEAAQKYYTRGFKESRRQLIERLLDPTLTLEDTARVLGVVPATVRRYTNRGVLPHHRTVGQQRRFRLSDVLGFLEGQQMSPRDEEEPLNV